MSTFVAQQILAGHPPGPRIGAQEQQGREQLHLPAALAGQAHPGVEGGLEPSAC